MASAVVSADGALIQGKLEYVGVPCTAQSNPIPGPVCPTGDTVGTPLEAFPHAGCEFNFEPAFAIGPVVEGFAIPGLTLLAVYRTDPSSGTPSVPAGDYVLAFVGPQAQLVAVVANADGGIVEWIQSCGATSPADFLAELPIGESIVPPVE